MSIDCKTSGQVVKEICKQMEAHLSPFGFVLNRKSGRYYFSDATHCIVVELQKSTRSTASVALFAVNAGIWNATLAANFSGPESAAGIHATDCHWWLRAGHLDDSLDERWWRVEVADDANAIANDVWPSLSPLIALLTSLKSDSEFLAHLLTTQTPQLDLRNRWAYALVLARAVGNQCALTQAVDALNGIGQKLYLSIGQRMLLREVTAL